LNLVQHRHINNSRLVVALLRESRETKFTLPHSTGVARI